MKRLAVNLAGLAVSLAIANTVIYAIAYAAGADIKTYLVASTAWVGGYWFCRFVEGPQ